MLLFHEKETYGIVYLCVKEWFYLTSGNKETLDLVKP
tara:strand:+ start:152 stop:262 length:111 start_codon:yes stop_codon:yes gene_type:complete